MAPAVLLAYDQALLRLRFDALTGFRNVVVLAAPLEARARLARQVGREGPQWGGSVPRRPCQYAQCRAAEPDGRGGLPVRLGAYALPCA